MRNGHGASVEGLEPRALFSLTPLPIAMEKPSFAIGRLVADPVKNIVYAVDLTNNKLVAIDTFLGRKVNDVALANPATALAVSLSGDRIFVGEQGGIEVFDTATLTPITSFPYPQPIDNMVDGAANELYVVSGVAVREVDDQTGTPGGGVGNGYNAPLIRTNADGTHLYIRSTSKKGFGGQPMIDEYDITDPKNVQLITSHVELFSNPQDFAVDEPTHQIFTADGGIAGIGVTDTNTETTSTLAMNNYGAAVATTSTSPFIFGMTQDGIEEFDKVSGVGLHYNPIAPIFGTGESLKVTPNGHAVFTDGTRFGILGTTSLVIDNVPDARFTATPNAGAFNFDASATTPYLPSQQITNYAWDFGDGTVATGVTTTHTFTPGRHTVTLTVTSSTGLVDSTMQQVLQIGPPPTATIGAGPFVVPEGGSINLSGSGTASAGLQVAKYEWDYNYNGTIFNVTATGATPVFSASMIDGPATRTVALRVTDNVNTPSTIVTTTVTITNVAPTATLSNSGGIILGNLETISFTGPTDPSAADNAAGFLYSFDFNNDGTYEVVDSASATTSFVPQAAGTYVVAGRIKDKDGGFTVYTTKFTVTPPPPPTLLAGTIVNDTSGDGVQQGNEGGLAGRTVFLDTNGDGIPDNGELTTTTNANGVWSFTALPFGTYTVRQVLPGGYRVTAGATSYTETLSSGSQFTKLNFYDSNRALLSGNVFGDLNGNGVKDGKEVGLAGWTVYLDTNNDGKMESNERSTLTDSAGNWAFKDLLAGKYTVRVVQPSTYKRTAPSAGYYSLTLLAAQLKTGVNFGEKKL